MANHDQVAAIQLESSDRITSLDVLRGLALLGMIVVHFHDRSTEPGGVDDVVRTLIWRLVESKSHGTFALLFGAGFAIQLRRAEQRGVPFVSLYLRRLGVLALFGFNVLLGYATWGVALLFIRRWSTRALIVTAVLTAVSLSLFHLAYTLILVFTRGPDSVETVYQARFALAESVNAVVDAAEAQGSYLVLLAARLRHMRWFYSQPFFFVPGVTLTLFIVGLLYVRHQVFEQVEQHRRLLGGMAAFGLVAWLADDWLLPSAGIEGSFGLFRDQWLTFTYVSAALLVMNKWPVLVQRLRLVANAGRMALTNYLVQIALLDLLFSSYAVGLGKIRPIAGLPMALALFTAQAAFSTAWLKSHRFGPAEWLWRSLTYGSRQPMRRTAMPVEEAGP